MIHSQRLQRVDSLSYVYSIGLSAALDVEEKANEIMTRTGTPMLRNASFNANSPMKTLYIPGRLIGRFNFHRKLQITRHQMSAAISKVRSLSAEQYGPVSKKPRLDATTSTDFRVGGTEGDEIVIREDQNQRFGPKVPKKKKKKKDPPLPEPCSPADVLYREIRSLLGENVVDEITQAGNAFKSPYSRGEEVVVKIRMIGSGGQSLNFTSLPFLIPFL